MLKNALVNIPQSVKNAIPRVKISSEPQGFSSERELFAFLRLTRRPVSFVSGKRVDTNLAPTYAHIISKGSRPDLRLFFLNIAFLTFEEHRLYDAGTFQEREMYARKTGAEWERLYARKEWLLLNYLNPL